MHVCKVDVASYNLRFVVTITQFRIQLGAFYPDEEGNFKLIQNILP
jgi:hypothetical protein